MKEYMQPKWWLTGVGGIFTLIMLLTYAEIGPFDAAESGWGANHTDNDAFYEKAWAATFLTFILVFLAADGLDYGFTKDPSKWAPPMIMATGLLVSGFLYLEEDE